MLSYRRERRRRGGRINEIARHAVATRASRRGHVPEIAVEDAVALNVANNLPTLSALPPNVTSVLPVTYQTNPSPHDAVAEEEDQEYARLVREHYYPHSSDQRIREMLNDETDFSDDTLNVIESVDVRRLRGRSRTLTQIMEVLDRGASVKTRKRCPHCNERGGVLKPILEERKYVPPMPVVVKPGPFIQSNGEPRRSLEPVPPTCTYEVYSIHDVPHLLATSSLKFICKKVRMHMRGMAQVRSYPTMAVHVAAHFIKKKLRLRCYEQINGNTLHPRRLVRLSPDEVSHYTLVYVWRNDKLWTPSNAQESALASIDPDEMIQAGGATHLEAVVNLDSMHSAKRSGNWHQNFNVALLETGNSEQAFRDTDQCSIVAYVGPIYEYDGEVLRYGNAVVSREGKVLRFNAQPVLEYSDRLLLAHGFTAPKAGDKKRIKVTTRLLNNTHCPICLAEFENGDFVRRLPCFHNFCKSCYDSWNVDQDYSKTACPVCKTPIMLDYHKLFAMIRQGCNQARITETITEDFSMPNQMKLIKLYPRRKVADLLVRYLLRDPTLTNIELYHQMLADYNKLIMQAFETRCFWNETVPLDDDYI